MSAARSELYVYLEKWKELADKQITHLNEKFAGNLGIDDGKVKLLTNLVNDINDYQKQSFAGGAQSDLALAKLYISCVSCQHMYKTKFSSSGTSQPKEKASFLGTLAKALTPQKTQGLFKDLEKEIKKASPDWLTKIQSYGDTLTAAEKSSLSTVGMLQLLKEDQRESYFKNLGSAVKTMQQQHRG